MRGAIVKGLALGAMLSGAAVAAATGAPTNGAPPTVGPVSTKPPTITGKPNYAQTLTCNKGTWSSNAASFTYAWAISGGSTIATGPTLKVPQSAIDFNVVCIVTARDAQGDTTPASSTQVLIGAGISTVKITKASVKKGLVTISGFVGPAGARKKGPNGWSTVVLDRELTSVIQVQQIGSPKTIRTKNGSFTVSGHDTKGMHIYVINYDPSAGSGFAPGRATRKLTVR
jgi:hypothetical protein